MKDNEMREMFASLRSAFEQGAKDAEHAFGERKDIMAELHERFDKLERMIEAATHTVVGGDPKQAQDRLAQSFASINAAFEEGARQAKERHEKREARLVRIQELLEAGRRFEKIELPSPRVLLFVGMLIGALIFALGMYIGTFLK